MKTAIKENTQTDVGIRRLDAEVNGLREGKRQQENNTRLCGCVYLYMWVCVCADKIIYKS